tara:strand:- start:7263 stop:7478 length:216 start_codon:yes stop_codon:yes gene_type:complete
MVMLLMGVKRVARNCPAELARSVRPRQHAQSVQNQNIWSTLNSVPIGIKTMLTATLIRQIATQIVKQEKTT